MNDPYRTPQTDATYHDPSAPLASAQSGVPKVFGILHLIFAVIGGIVGLANLAAPFILTTTYTPFIEASNGHVRLQQALDHLITISTIDGALRVILTVVLLLAGIQLLKKKHLGVKLSKIWAITRIVIAVPLVYLTVTAQAQMMSAIGEVIPNSLDQGVNGVGIGLGIVVLCLYPLITLIFLSQATVKNSLT